MRLPYALIIGVGLLLPLDAGNLLPSMKPGRKSTDNFHEQLDWTKNSINSFAQTHYQNPPSVESTTTWQMETTGCHFEVTEKFHRESRNNIVTKDGTMSVYEDSSKVYNFELADLTPEQMRGVTAEATPYIILSSGSDIYRVQEEHSLRTLRESGEEKSKSQWSTDERARRLWIYFGSGKTDNTKLVRELQYKMRATIDYCRRARASHIEVE